MQPHVDSLFETIKQDIRVILNWKNIKKQTLRTVLFDLIGRLRSHFSTGRNQLMSPRCEGCSSSVPNQENISLDYAIREESLAHSFQADESSPSVNSSLLDFQLQLLTEDHDRGQVYFEMTTEMVGISACSQQSLLLDGCTLCKKRHGGSEMNILTHQPRQ